MNLKILNHVLDHLNYEDRLHWIFLNYHPDDILVSSSFGIYSSAFLSIISKLNSKLNIYFVDTGYHFQETWAHLEQLKKLFNLNVVVLKKNTKVTDINYKTDPDYCCHKNKVEPLYKELSKKKIWLSGIHAFQSDYRKNLSIIEKHKTEVLKVNPLIDWTFDELESFMKLHELPFHPLYKRGFKSIGCFPCTIETAQNSNMRSGRWHDIEKTECGLHL